MKRYVIFILLFLTFFAPAKAANELSDSAVVSLLTVAPFQGRIWTVYGHTAIRVLDPANRLDIAFNYGIFDYSKPHFIYRFTKGETDYQLGAQSFNDFMTKLLGNKSQRDLKEITPFVDKIKAVYPSIEKLSNDELRAKSQELMKKVADYVTEDRAKIDELRSGIEEKELEEREAIWTEVDKREKDVTEKLEEILNEILPEAFSIMKDTARRFKENETIEVTATDFDRDLAATHE